MKQVLLVKGQAVVEEVPVPKVETGHILVEVNHSCISIGTELSGLKMSGAPLWKRALKQPENVKKVLKMVASSGISRTHSIVKGQLEAGNPTGYSATGIVIEIGEGVEHFKVGDRVACAGAQCAHHAEIICVPANLACLIPDNLEFESASTVTLGAIAMQGVRRASPTLGETFVVIGLGILGQITMQLLKSNGCRVIGIDLDLERIQLAESLGMDYGIRPEDGQALECIQRLTQGLGADGIIITAASASDEIISNAFQFCRKKGRVVLVGDVGLHLNRADFYAKELDFFISCSYGPGRYDRRYEEEGLDYPVAYVRWTENRNMDEYLRLMAENKINIRALINLIYPIEEASQAYAKLKNGHEKPLMVLLKYTNTEQNKLLRKVLNPLAVKHQGQRIEIAVVGAGGFAKGMHLPNLAKLTQEFVIKAIVSRKGHNAMATAKQFGASYGTTDYQEVLKDKEIDAILLTTRHDLHAEMVMEALKAHKHVLVEKPLALNEKELNEIKAFYEKNDQNPPMLLTGFNRRFSPIMQSIKHIVDKRISPMIISYRMNAGYIPLEHWVHGPQGGGRNIGEACHIYDVFTFLTNAKVQHIHCKMIHSKTKYYTNHDNFSVQISFEDGSIANFIYTALGSKDYPKEQMEVFVDGKVLVMKDFKNFECFGAKVANIQHQTHEKGQMEELKAFAHALHHDGVWPIPLWQQLQATEISFQVDKYLNQSREYENVLENH